MTARWYIIHVYSNFEQKVASSIREQALQQGLDDMFEEVLVPTEELVEVKRGKKVNAERKFFPGYVLVKMELTDETWHLVRNTAKVTGFLGPNGKPAPITEEEAERIQNQMQEGTEHPRPLITFLSGDQVRVVDGPFSSFNGTVEEVDEHKGRLKVSASRFSAGRRRSSWNTRRSSDCRKKKPTCGSGYGRARPRLYRAYMRSSHGQED